ncbi:MAG: hypothetical protein LBQ66_09380, partial [Planctomycetaceae bacterium]|nr:hypothetical protein [Planctomycetaceae bacterium]
GLRRRYSPRKPGGRLPTLRSPTRLGVQFKLVWFYYTQRRAGRPRSSPRRFAANVVGCADIGRFGFSGAFWRSSCRLAPTQPPGGRLPTLVDRLFRKWLFILSRFSLKYFCFFSLPIFSVLPRL